MKKISLPLALLYISFAATGCSVVGGIFKAGMWTGVIGLVLLAILVIWLFSRLSR